MGVAYLVVQCDRIFRGGGAALKVLESYCPVPTFLTLNRSAHVVTKGAQNAVKVALQGSIILGVHALSSGR
ncbi:hypothetical protein NFJ02_02g73680 [Pycnococcus provasolii]